MIYWAFTAMLNQNRFAHPHDFPEHALRQPNRNIGYSPVFLNLWLVKPMVCVRVAFFLPKPTCRRTTRTNTTIQFWLSQFAVLLWGSRLHGFASHRFFARIFCTDFLHGFSARIFCTDFLRGFFPWIFCTDFLHGFSARFFA